MITRSFWLRVIGVPHCGQGNVTPPLLFVSVCVIFSRKSSGCFINVIFGGCAFSSIFAVNAAKPYQRAVLFVASTFHGEALPQ
jgi:hypothetical protein